MIDEKSVPPFVAYRLTPKRQIRKIKIVAVEQHSWGIRFISDLRGSHDPARLWSNELELLQEVKEWTEIRKATLKAELAKLEANELRIEKRLREIATE